MALKPCAKVGCGALVKRGQRHCAAHGGNANWHASQQRKGNTTERGYGHSWRKLRARILKRDHYQCQAHKRQGMDVAAQEVDHIVPKAQGGSDDPANLEALCAPCHRAKTAAEGGGGVKSLPSGRP